MATSLPGWLIGLLIAAYVTALFLLSRQADRALGTQPRRLRAMSHALSLAALCSSWTYFGAAGLAIEGSWLYVANFVGPILMIGVFYPVWRRIAVLAKQENVGSIADFLSARYGKSRALGSIVAGVAIIAALPYISLQFISLSKAWAYTSGRAEAPALAAPVLVVLLSALAILFGARRPSLTQHNRGLTRLVAIESVVKLLALLSVAGLATWLVAQSVFAGQPIPAVTPIGSPLAISLVTATVICMASALTLPRQFHLSFVALEDADDVRTARWAFPAYMALWMVAILPIALAARAGFIPPGTDRNMAVLGLPMAQGGTTMLTLAFIGGFSAGAAMVVVETVALSAMISNDLILPWLARTRWYGRRNHDVGRLIILIRRLTIVLIHLLAWAYFSAIRVGSGLTELGFTSLTASAQLLPALIGGVVWRRGHARGAIAGLAVGMAIWLVGVAGPGLAGYAGLGLPTALVDRQSFEWGIVASLALNLATYVVVSLRTTPRLIDEIQAATFVARRQPAPAPAHQTFGAATIGDLRRLVARFVGEDEARRMIEDAGKGYAWGRGESDPVTPVIARSTERILAGVIGASSARNVVAIYLAADTHDAAQISQILDEAAHAVQFSREILQMTLDSLEEGVGVFDPEGRLVVWNRRYGELLDVPGETLQIGLPLSQLVGVNADAAMRARTKHVEERRDAGAADTIVQLIGTPLTSGDYLVSLSDVTAVRRATRTLADSNEVLERRVRDRTAELTKANAVAERAMRTQRRFVAATSHDLLQPLHAARLFIAAAAEDVRRRPGVRDLMAKADLSLDSADRLLKALLNLSRLEVGGLKPSVTAVDVAALFRGLQQELDPLARSRGVELVVMPTTRWVASDADLLRSVLQNLLTNAVRYAPGGRVVLACRRDGDGLRIEVRDNGIGIAPEQVARVFEEFARLPSQDGVAGTGLGLSIAERLCAALGHRIQVRSQVGGGSVFSVHAPIASPATGVASPPMLPTALGSMRILVIEDDPDVLAATRSLLESWAADVTTASDAAAAAGLEGSWDVVIADYHLGSGVNGLALLDALKSRSRARLLMTANPEDEVARSAAASGVALLRKPIATPVLRAFLAQLRTVDPVA